MTVRTATALGPGRRLPGAIRLPFDLPTVGLRAEIEAVDTTLWTEHFNTGLYDGDWSGVALRAAAGSDHAITELHNPPSADRFVDLPLLDRCPHIRSIMERLRCELRSVRLLRLAPGGVIREHTDHGLGHRFGEVRLHAPVVTNPDVEFRIDGQRVDMVPGELWYLDASLPHSVHNGGTVARVHLVVDAVVNEWLEGLLHHGDTPPAHTDGSADAPPDDAGWPLESRYQEPVTGQIIEFVRSIGIEVNTCEIPTRTLLPGVTVADGVIWVDPARLSHPGDVLHEAGHLALLTPDEVRSVRDSTDNDGGMEMMAIAWSWAALTHIEIDPHEVFHADGYHGDSQWLIDTFAGGTYIGLPGLQWLGLAADPDHAATLGVAPYPHMLCWRRR